MPVSTSSLSQTDPAGGTRTARGEIRANGPWRRIRTPYAPAARRTEKRPNRFVVVRATSRPPRVKTIVPDGTGALHGRISTQTGATGPRSTTPRTIVLGAASAACSAPTAASAVNTTNARNIDFKGSSRGPSRQSDGRTSSPTWNGAGIRPRSSHHVLARYGRSLLMRVLQFANTVLVGTPLFGQRKAVSMNSSNVQSPCSMYSPASHTSLPATAAAP